MPASPAPDYRLPEYYQQVDVEAIFQWLTSGESCSIVEVGSQRAQPLLRFITRADIRERHLGTTQATYNVMLVLSPNQMLTMPEPSLVSTGPAWSGYEIMLDRLRRRLAIMLRENGLLQQGQDLLDFVAGCHGRLFGPTALATQAGLRPLEDALAAVLNFNNHMRVVFMFDQIDAFMHLPPNFWESLRGLRDEYAGRCMFVSASHRPLAALMQTHYGVALAQDFVSMFEGFTRFTNRLDGPSTRAVIEALEQRYHLSIAGDLLRSLSYTVGRHPGLLCCGFQVAASLGESSGMSDEGFLDVLLLEDSIQEECQAIYASLSPAAQVLLREIVSLAPLDTSSTTWQDLLAQHLVTLTDDRRPVLTIPVLAMYIRDCLDQT